MELETSAVPFYGRTGCVGEHVLVTGFRRERNARPDPRQTTLQVQEELISRLPIEIYVYLRCYCCGRILGNIGALAAKKKIRDENESKVFRHVKD